VFFAVYYILLFPSAFYRNFLLEHQFGLSNESIKGFFADELKKALLHTHYAPALSLCFIGFMNDIPLHGGYIWPPVCSPLILSFYT